MEVVKRFIFRVCEVRLCKIKIGNVTLEYKHTWQNTVIGHKAGLSAARSRVTRAPCLCSWFYGGSCRVSAGLGGAVDFLAV